MATCKVELKFTSASLLVCSEMGLAGEYTRDITLGDIDHSSLAGAVANLSTVFAQYWEPKKPWVRAARLSCLLSYVFFFILLCGGAFLDLTMSHGEMPILPALILSILMWLAGVISTTYLERDVFNRGMSAVKVEITNMNSTHAPLNFLFQEEQGHRGGKKFYLAIQNHLVPVVVAAAVVGAHENPKIGEENPAMPRVTEPGKYDQLRDVKCLLDEGVLTEKEFESEKQKILAFQV